MNFNTNPFYAFGSFLLGALLIVLAHTPFTRFLEPLFYTFLDDGTITGMFRAMDVAYDTMMTAGAVFLLTSAYFTFRYIPYTSSKTRRMTAIIFATLVAAHGVFIVVAYLV